VKPAGGWFKPLPLPSKLKYLGVFLNYGIKSWQPKPDMLLTVPRIVENALP
jgi:hypothetical protein